MEKYVCGENACTGCRACVAVCAKNAIMIRDTMEKINAIVDTTKCVNCNLCYSVCPNNHPVEQRQPIIWHQGWSNSQLLRQKSSSGGLAAALAKTFVQNGGSVCSCVFRNGDFVFDIVDEEDKLEQFRGSKYVKSNLLDGYKEIKLRLQQGKSVLFIGLPCQAAAVIKYVGPKLQNQLLTVDLICHGTPSYELFKLYMNQYGFDVTTIEKIDFRKKNDFKLYVNDRAIIHPRIQDNYTLSFLEALNYTENCYACQYATVKRVSDITIGDSWGSQLTEEVNKGISLVLCQTEKGYDLLKQAQIHLEEVNLEEACKHNHQLCHPAFLPKQREKFFKRINKKVKYDYAVTLAYPAISVKQKLKYILLKILSYKSKEK